MHQICADCPKCGECSDPENCDKVREALKGQCAVFYSEEELRQKWAKMVPLEVLDPDSPMYDPTAVPHGDLDWDAVPKYTPERRVDYWLRWGLSEEEVADLLSD